MEFMQLIGEDGKKKFLNIAQIRWIEETKAGGAIIVGQSPGGEIPISAAAWEKLKARLEIF